MSFEGYQLKELPLPYYICNANRDGTNFRFILNYLRTGKLSIPDDPFLLNELEEEAVYYNLQSFLEAIKVVVVDLDVFPGTTLLTREHQTILGDWIASNLTSQVIRRG
jgi:hypothetical protein